MRRTVCLAPTALALQVDEKRRVERYFVRNRSAGAGSASCAASRRSRSASCMTGAPSSAASMAAAVRGAGGHTARLITFEKDSSGMRRAFRNRSYASRLDMLPGNGVAPQFRKEGAPV